LIYFEDNRCALHHGDALEVLRLLPGESANACVTSPPYWGLRDYNSVGQIGLEESPDAYVAKLVEVFREVRRVLQDDGTLWLNLGDSYATGGGKVGRCPGGGKQGERWGVGMSGDRFAARSDFYGGTTPTGPLQQPNRLPIPGMKPKDLVGIPWMVAFALRADGWYLRSDIIWAKPNAMPESVTDRPTKSHEYIFLLSKSERYYYDAEAIKEPSVDFGLTSGAYQPPGQTPHSNARMSDKQRGHSRRHAGFNDRWDAMERAEQCAGMRNKRDVWTVPPAQFKESHFATFPPDLIRPCVRAGCPRGGVVIDPFNGAGTSGVVAIEEGCRYVGIDINVDYLGMSVPRLQGTISPMFDDVSDFMTVGLNVPTLFDFADDAEAA
jgi:DNA modification methylase